MTDFFSRLAARAITSASLPRAVAHGGAGPIPEFPSEFPLSPGVDTGMPLEFEGSPVPSPGERRSTLPDPSAPHSSFPGDQLDDVPTPGRPAAPIVGTSMRDEAAETSASSETRLRRADAGPGSGTDMPDFETVLDGQTPAGQVRPVLADAIPVNGITDEDAGTALPAARADEPMKRLPDEHASPTPTTVLSGGTTVPGAVDASRDVDAGEPGGGISFVRRFFRRVFTGGPAREPDIAAGDAASGDAPSAERAIVGTETPNDRQPTLARVLPRAGEPRDDVRDEVREDEPVSDASEPVSLPDDRSSMASPAVSQSQGPRAVQPEPGAVPERGGVVRRLRSAVQAIIRPARTAVSPRSDTATAEVPDESNGNEGYNARSAEAARRRSPSAVAQSVVEAASRAAEVATEQVISAMRNPGSVPPRSAAPPETSRMVDARGTAAPTDRDATAGRPDSPTATATAASGAGNVPRSMGPTRRSDGTDSAPDNGRAPRRSQAARSDAAAPGPKARSAGHELQPPQAGSDNLAPARAHQVRQAEAVHEARRAAESTPAVKISIGRIEVRAPESTTPPQHRQRTAPQPSGPKLTLSEYLKQRNRGDQ